MGGKRGGWRDMNSLCTHPQIVVRTSSPEGTPGYGLKGGTFATKLPPCSTKLVENTRTLTHHQRTVAFKREAFATDSIGRGTPTAYWLDS